MCNTCETRPGFLGWLFEKLAWWRYMHHQSEIFESYLDNIEDAAMMWEGMSQALADQALAIREEGYEQAYKRYLIKCAGLGVVPREPLDY